MCTTRMSLKKRSVHQPRDDNAPPYWTRKRTKMTKTTNHSIPLNRPESMLCLLPSQTRRNTMSLVLSLGQRKAKDQPPERDRLRQATFGPGSASAPTAPHLLLPLRQPPRENRRHLAHEEPKHQEQQPEAEDEDHEAKGHSKPAGTSTSISLAKVATVEEPSDLSSMSYCRRH